MKNHLILICCAATLLLTACQQHHNPAILTKTVDISSKHPDSSCTKVGKISAPKGKVNSRSWTSNCEQMEHGYRYLKDKAATRGANYVEITGGNRTHITGTAYWCPINC